MGDRVGAGVMQSPPKHDTAQGAAPGDPSCSLPAALGAPGEGGPRTLASREAISCWLVVEARKLLI